jgi:hypothetical protein
VSTGPADRGRRDDRAHIDRRELPAGLRVGRRDGDDPVDWV